MIRIAIGGLKKKEMKIAIEGAGQEEVEVIETTDIQAANMIKRGKVDYYFGACNSGGGAALSILIGMLGYNKCSTVAKTGSKPNEDEISELVSQGKVAFGMSVENIDKTVPILIKILLNK